MSYILDALKRADAQRERHAAPGLLTQAGAALPPAASDRAAPVQRALLLALALVFLVAGALALAWQWGAFDAPPAASAAQAPVTPPVASVVIPVAPVVPPPSAAPLALPAPAAPLRAAPAQATAEPAAEPEKTPVLEVTQLPASVRQQLPQVNVSGSTYSSNPAHRLLIANGQVLREGDALAPGHAVEQIREKSAVLNYKGTRYLLRY